MPTTLRRPRAKLLRYELGPFFGVREQVDPESAELRRYATAMLNLWPVDGDAGAAVEQRPSLERWTAGTPIALAGGAVQGTAAFVTATSKYTVLFVGGAVWKVTFISGAEEPEPQFTDVTPTGVTISTTARIEAIMFNDELIVTDGVNRPWRWDGGASASFLTDVTAGQTVRSPTVYVAKLFFVKTGGSGPGLPNRSLIWSEELAPDTGYENVAYDNYWNLAVTDQEPLVAVRGTNDALVYWRETAIGLIQGKVSSTFTADATHDSVSTSVGTGYPWHIDLHDGKDFYFLDRDGRPFKYTVGAGLTDLWRLCRVSAPGKHLKASLTTTARESLFAGALLVAVNDAEVSAVLAHAPANGDFYEIRYHIYLSITATAAGTARKTMEVAIDSYDGAVYTEIGSRSFSVFAFWDGETIEGEAATHESDELVSGAVAGLGATSAFRVRIKSITTSGVSFNDNASSVNAQRVNYMTTPTAGAMLGQDAWVQAVPGYDLVVIGGYRVPGLQQDSGLLVFDALTDRFYGVWQSADEAALIIGAIGRHGTEQEVLVMLSSLGHAYRLAHRSKAGEFGGDFLAGMWDDPLPAATAFARRVTGPPVGAESKAAKLWDRVTVEARAQAAAQSLSVSLETNETAHGTALVPMLPTGVTGRTVKTEAGFARHGRHAVVRIAQAAAQQTTVQPFAFVGCVIEGTAVGDATPGVR